MAMDFPNSPTVNQTFTVGDKTWKYTGTGWDIVVNRPPMRSVSDAPPSSPILGDEWFNSSTGRTYQYYSSTWVEVNTNSIAGANGLNGVASATAPLVYNSTNNNISVQAGPTFTDGIITNAGSDGQVLKLKARSSDQFNQIAWYNSSGSNFMGLWQVQPDSSIKFVQNTSYAGSTQTFVDRLAINTSGHISLPAQPVFQCGPYVSSMAGNAYIDISNDITTNIGFTLTNSTTLTVQTAGKYLVVARHLMSSTASNYYHLQKNNATVKHGWTNNIMIDYGVSAVVDCAANDTLRLYLGNAINGQWNGAHSSLLVVKVA